MFKGSIPALITPFKNLKIDYESFSSIIEWSILNGSHGFVPCGTTGESPTLSHDEHKKIVEECVKVVDKRVPVIAGTGSNNTLEAIELTNHAEKSGASAALVVTPYYNKPTQEGLYFHYKKIAESTSLPIVIYNIPGRSTVDMNIDTMKKLSLIENIVGVKDATNDLLTKMVNGNNKTLLFETKPFQDYLAQLFENVCRNSNESSLTTFKSYKKSKLRTNYIIKTKITLILFLKIILRIFKK